LFTAFSLYKVVRKYLLAEGAASGRLAFEIGFAMCVAKVSHLGSAGKTTESAMFQRVMTKPVQSRPAQPQQQFSSIPHQTFSMGLSGPQQTWQDALLQLLRTQRMGTTIVICSLGALLGLLFALFANLVVLPSVLSSLETYEGGKYRELRNLVALVYRYVMPIVFAATGVAAAYYAFFT
jgi:hypothetical protein